MKKYFLLVLTVLAIVTYYGCSKSLPDNPACTNALPYSDSTVLKDFAGDSIPLTMDSTGLIYNIIDSGSSVKPGPTALMTVTYVGRTMDNHIFDSASNTNLRNTPLNYLILGWRLGLPKIGVGGHIQLFIPSAYAWGCTGYSGIAPNAPVFFDVTLISLN